VKWKNEYSYLTAMPASYGTGQAIGRMGSAGTLVGVETPAQSMNLELKPYGVSSVTTDNTIAEPFSNHGKRGRGLRFQVRAHAQPDRGRHGQYRLCPSGRGHPAGEPDAFQPLLPEKREFFLEGQGIFAFGGVGSGNGTPATSR